MMPFASALGLLGAERLAFSYSVPMGGIPESPLDNDPYLRRQLSPDGRQIVVSTNEGLVVVDLASGQSRRLGIAGQFPSWSKDGSQVAYIAPVSQPDPQVSVPDHAIWVAPIAGGTPRELVNVGYSITAPEGSPDGTLVLAQLKDGVGLVDVAAAREVAGGRIPYALSTTGAHWHVGTDQAAVTIIRRDDTQLVVYDHRAQVTGYLAQFARPYDPSPCRCPKGLVPSDPRWSPAGNGEILYVVTIHTVVMQ